MAVWLAIETAGTEASLALGDEMGRVLAVARCTVPRRHAEFVAPALSALLHGAGNGDLDGVIVDRGPGQFTGLRVGLATAAALHLARDVPVVGVTSLQVLAHGSAVACGVAVDVRRGECAVAVFAPGETAPGAGPALVPRDACVAWLRERGAEELRADLDLDGSGLHPLSAPDLLAAGLVLAGRPGPHEATPLYLRRVDARLWSDDARL